MSPPGGYKSLQLMNAGNGPGLRVNAGRIQREKTRNQKYGDDFMSKDGTNRGGARPGAGRKPKAISEKIASGNPGGRKLTVVDFGGEAVNLKGSEMPPVKDYLKARQKDGSVTCAEEIYKEIWEWLRARKCDQLIPVQQIEQYAMSVARWIQCEEAVSEFGFLAKKPTGTVFSSPYVTMAREYMKQANLAWYQIYQVVKENCTVDLGDRSPQDDVMERLLTARMGGRR